jgi:hypothetical protein
VPAATRAQIEADVARPTFAVTLDGADVSSDVTDISGALEQTSGADGIGFGVVVQPSADVGFSRESFTRTYQDRSLTIAYGFETSDKTMFFKGVASKRERGDSTGSWQARGFDALIEATDIRSPLFYQRAIATRTTATSIEDPSNPAYRGGLINFCFWKAGGRPAGQGYSNPAFEYQCGDSILTPTWSWLNGEDGMQAIGNLCRAAGGIVYQDSQGRMRYVEPFALAAAAATFHYTDAHLTAAQRVAQSAGNYGSIRDSEETTIAVGTVRSTFVQRLLQGNQQIYEDRSPIRLAPSETLTLPLDLSLPCYIFDRVEIEAAIGARAQKLVAGQVAVSASLVAAQRISLTLTNTLSEAVTVWSRRAWGHPLVAGEEGSASFSAAVSRPRARDLELEDSVFVQSRSFAERRCRMYWDFYSEPRPIIRLGNCGFDPDRSLGEIVTLTNAARSWSQSPHRIVALRPARAGALMDVDLVPISGLPKTSDFFIVGNTYSDATVLQLAY